APGPHKSRGGQGTWRRRPRLPPNAGQATVAGDEVGSRSQQQPGTPAATATPAVSRAGACSTSGSGAGTGVGREGRKRAAKAAPAKRTPAATRQPIRKP